MKKKRKYSAVLIGILLLLLQGCEWEHKTLVWDLSPIFGDKVEKDETKGTEIRGEENTQENRSDAINKETEPPLNQKANDDEKSNPVKQAQDESGATEQVDHEPTPTEDEDLDQTKPTEDIKESGEGTVDTNQTGDKQGASQSQNTPNTNQGNNKEQNVVQVETVSKIMYATVPLNIRSGPGTTYKIVGALNKGDEANILGKAKKWYQIKFGEGTAYVASDYFTTDKSSVVIPDSLYRVEPDPKTMEGQILVLLNAYRVENGLQPFIMDSRLIEVAAVRAKEIETLFSHQRPDGRSCLTAFVDTRNTDFTCSGENIAQGYESAQDVFDAWIDSKPHRENILNASFKRVGMAIWHGTYIAQEFAD